jgi:Tfp pilus assembly protein FimT
VVLLVIIAAIAVPSMSPVVLGYRLRGAAWQLAGDLRLARQRAVTVRNRFRICVTNCAIPVPAGTYSVERDVGTPTVPRWVNEVGAVTKLPADVTVSVSQSVAFNVTGQASPNTFTLVNLMGTYQVTVSSTGRVRVCAGSCP